MPTSVRLSPPAQLRRVHREHRQDEEQAEHAQAEDAGEAGAGAQFGRSHRVRACTRGMGCGWNAKRAIVASFTFAAIRRWISIRIRGARTHNLKNISLELPRNRLVVITGLSGSGKISLAFDTLYAEGQRRYVESLSAYARQFLRADGEARRRPRSRACRPRSRSSRRRRATTRARRSARSPRSTTTCACSSRAPARPTAPSTASRCEAQTVAQMVDHVLALPEDTQAR